jgi:hypothetical protein
VVPYRQQLNPSLPEYVIQATGRKMEREGYFEHIQFISRLDLEF